MSPPGFDSALAWAKAFLMSADIGPLAAIASLISGVQASTFFFHSPARSFTLVSVFGGVTSSFLATGGKDLPLSAAFSAFSRLSRAAGAVGAPFMAADVAGC